MCGGEGNDGSRIWKCPGAGRLLPYDAEPLEGPAPDVAGSSTAIPVSSTVSPPVAAFFFGGRPRLGRGRDLLASMAASSAGVRVLGGRPRGRLAGCSPSGIGGFVLLPAGRPLPRFATGGASVGAAWSEGPGTEGPACEAGASLESFGTATSGASSCFRFRDAAMRGAVRCRVVGSSCRTEDGGTRSACVRST